MEPIRQEALMNLDVLASLAVQHQKDFHLVKLSWAFAVFLFSRLVHLDAAFSTLVRLWIRLTVLLYPQLVYSAAVLLDCDRA